MKQESVLSKDEQNEIKQLEIEQKDERNRALGDAAKARAYELMLWLYSIAIVVLVLLDRISLFAFFILLGVFVTCQIYFVIRLKKYHEER